MTASPHPGHAVPTADVVVDLAVAQRLLRAQRPDLADLPLVEVSSGFDNVTFRLGRDLALRLPRRAFGAQTLPGEQRVLPHLAPHLDLEVPLPVHLGRPDDGYPYPWAVVEWTDGECLEAEALPGDDATVVADFLDALRAAAAVDDPPGNPFRGGHLDGCTARLGQRLGDPALRRRARDLSVDLDVLRARFERAAGVPIAASPAWAHGDLHPRNLVVRPDERGRPRLTGVIDWGDVVWGDAAVDLVVWWTAFDDPEARRVGAARTDDAAWERGIGWSIVLGVMLLSVGDDPTLQAIGSRCVRNLVSEA